MAFVTMKRNPNYLIDLDTLEVKLNERSAPFSNPYYRVWTPTYINGKYCYKLLPMDKVSDFNQNPTYDTTSLSWVNANTSDMDTPLVINVSGNDLNPQNYTLREMSFYGHFVYDILVRTYWLEDILRDQEFKSIFE
tara:strand:+ start:50 stop:457 length:408 start_codon:yes stop_codon:yes gene_type:complete